MNLTLATVTAAAPDGCHVEALDGRSLFARYSRLVLKRIKIRPHQLVAIDQAPGGPEVVWRWFRGPVLLLADGFAVVDSRPCQPGFHRPLEVVLVPEHLRGAIGVGTAVFYTGHEDGAVAALVVGGRPADPGWIAAELFPAIEQIYAEGGDA